MKILLNGKSIEFSENNLNVSQLLKKINLANFPVVVEVNGIAIIASMYEETKIEEGAKVEIVELTAGG